VNASPVVCPRCRSSNQLQKVSAAVDEGTSTASYGYRGISAQTQLARQLSMPERPVAVRTENGTAGCMGTGAVWLVIGIIITIILGMTNFLANQLHRYMHDWPSAMKYAAIICVIGFVITIIPVASIASRKSARELDRVKAEQWAWDQMKLIWDRLYYCSRDGIVFPPNNTSNYTPAELMRPWLIRQVK
jgi:hypothetical protein